jgi:hypothetical protein
LFYELKQISSLEVFSVKGALHPLLVWRGTTLSFRGFGIKLAIFGVFEV